ncbi:hypothetical protein [Polycladidibacter hongkongensis]|uniref:hypothetical protein n=1 Tax=Polycladidibacter hongkongensis TaxID=1647556 RepID=UPI000829D27A|nr:hypothetical protein [Pseudovibrio hongkongensis]
MARQLMKKGAFAIAAGVSAGRVSQWISEGKISGEAIVGEGRSAQIDVAIAVRQLQARLDSGQMMGNGIGTRLSSLSDAAAAKPSPETDLPASPGPAIASEHSPAPPAAPVSTTTTQIERDEAEAAALARDIKAEQLKKIQRENAQAEEAKRLAEGQLMPVGAAIKTMGEMTRAIIAAYDGGVRQLASLLAPNLSNMDARELEHLLTREFKKLRVEAAKRLNAQAKGAPPLMDETSLTHAQRCTAHDPPRQPRAPSGTGNGQGDDAAAAGGP